MTSSAFVLVLPTPTAMKATSYSAVINSALWMICVIVVRARACIQDDTHEMSCSKADMRQVTMQYGLRGGSGSTAEIVVTCRPDINDR